MVTEKHLYRARDAVAGGVCSGIAEYFNVDPVVIRILTIFLTLITGGLFAVAYGALWLILPFAPYESKPFDVKPDSVHSETYGPVHYPESPPIDTELHPAPPAAMYGVPGVYQGVGHIPPEPPEQYPSCPVPPDYSPGGAGFSRYPEASRMPFEPTQSAASPLPVEAKPASKSSVKTALRIGYICLALGMAALIGHFINGISWWQLWPLIFVIVGIGQIVIPGNQGYRVKQLFGGIVSIVMGIFLLLMTVDIMSYTSLAPIFGHLWPLLLVIIGLYLIGGVTKAPLFSLLANVCFVAFFVIGVLWFAIPGATDELSVELPFRSAIVLDVNPWI